MSKTIDGAIDQLRLCFPHGYLNYNREFIADRKANRQYGSACCRLRECKTSEDVICAVIESLSLDCCKSRPFKTAEANVDFRRYMIAGMNAFLGVSFAECDFLIVHTHLGCAINRRLTFAFMKSGYNLDLLKKHKQDRMISADNLLETINGLEYKARSLEQMRGGNDVLRRLLPKLINQQKTLRALPATRCGRCDYWESDMDDTYGWCALYGCTKYEGGFCDSGKERTEDAVQ